MQAAKHGIDLRAVVEPLFEIEQPMLDLFEQFAGLDPEHVYRIKRAHCNRHEPPTWWFSLE
jgi:hypothetical protein